MAVRQTKNPNVSAPGRRGWCLEYVDNAIGSPSRTPSAQAAYNNEARAGRIHTDAAPVGVWVIGFLSFTKGAYVNLGHVFLMKNNGGGNYEIRDTEVRAGARGVYTNIDQVIAWFGAYGPRYIGYSFSCDGATIAESYTPAVEPVPGGDGIRHNAHGTARVLVDVLNIRNSPHPVNGAVVDTYKKGQTFNYDSFIVINGFVWLSYNSYSGVRRYVAEGPNDGRDDTVFVSGGV
jgi:SH3 domain-containing protein